MFSLVVILSNKASTTSYSRPEVLTKDSKDVSVAVTHLRLVVKDFSFMSVAEVEPVNYATVIGAAGGAWRKFLFRNTVQTIIIALRQVQRIRPL